MVNDSTVPLPTSSAKSSPVSESRHSHGEQGFHVHQQDGKGVVNKFVQPLQKQFWSSGVIHAKMQLNPDSRETNPKSSLVRLVIAVVLVILMMRLIAAICVPNFVHSGPSKLSGIFNTLRQVDGAKQQWAYERGITNAAQLTKQITEQDMAPYLSGGRDRIDRNGFGFDRNGYPHPGAGEKYVVNPLGVSPEAQLTRIFKEGYGSTFSLPKGTIIRLSGVREEIILPGQTTNQTRQTDSRPN